jgi:ascorbate-specific PTS system EIIC-type component UlaA
VAELQSAFPGIDTRLIPGSGGIFDVTADGKLVFSKNALGRHAKPGEIVDLLKGVS